ncbi:MAG: hypothetical protein R2932_49385 [Caldilineaceae bacterium]
MLGPTADMTVLKQSQLLERLPVGFGAIGDLATSGLTNSIQRAMPLLPARKPCGHDRPPEDIAFNTAFSRRRIDGNMPLIVLRFEALSQMDRHHRRSHTARQWLLSVGWLIAVWRTRLPSVFQP